MFGITTDPIRAEQLHSLVQTESDGAIATFVGVVRGNSAGKKTAYLFYEAYGEMAESKMMEIGREVADRWPIGSVAAVHRVGRLEIGEISVLVAVGSPHRGEAFEACRYYIDRLKEVVPIWKKEFGPDGAFWVGGPDCQQEGGVKSAQ